MNNLLHRVFKYSRLVGSLFLFSSKSLRFRGDPLGGTWLQILGCNYVLGISFPWFLTPKFGTAWPLQALLSRNTEAKLLRTRISCWTLCKRLSYIFRLGRIINKEQGVCSSSLGRETTDCMPEWASFGGASGYLCSRLELRTQQGALCFLPKTAFQEAPWWSSGGGNWGYLAWNRQVSGGTRSPFSDSWELISSLGWL